MSQFADARISPVFRYRDADAAVAWLTRAFGFTTQEVHRAPSGEIVHAELRCGASGLGLSSAGPVVPGNPWSAVRLGIYVCLNDVDALFNRAAASAFEVAQPLNDTSYGAREGSLRDSGGHLWSLGTWPMANPVGAPTIFVALHYADGKEAARLLEEGLAFRRGMMVHDEDASVLRHGELTLGRDVLMVSSSPRAGVFEGLDSQCTCVYVDDVDAHFANASAAGATVLQPPRDTPYGARDYYVQDPEQFVWGFGNYRPAE